jgi:hypothetical protein
MESGTKQLLKAAGFGNEVQRVEHGFCPLCSRPVCMDDFKDDLSRQEYQISGMCAICQDEMFG